MSNPCLNQALRQSSRVLTKFYDDKLAVIGLRGGQFSVLRTVSFRIVTTNTELQTLLVIDQTTLSRNLKPLVRDGLITLIANPDDHRMKQIRLSPEGRRLYQLALPIWEKAQTEIKTRIGIKNAEQILATSSAIIRELS